MKFSVKISGMLVAAAFSTLLFSSQSIQAKADAYTYQVKISLGNNEDAYFDEAVVADLQSKYSVTASEDELVIDKLEYNDTLSLTADSLVKIKPDETTGQSKYYVSGLRVSGNDTVLKNDSLANLAVTSDETYVVAYGVGSTIPYTVAYVDGDGNALLPEDTLYAAKGEVILVPAKHVNGYYPDALYRTASKGLKEDTVFTFVYSKYTGEVTYVEDTTYSSSTEYGEPTYEYQYTTRNGGNDNAGGQGNAGRNAAGNAGNGAAAGDNAGAGDAADGADEETAEEIVDDEVPLDVIDIDDEQVALAGGTKDPLVRNMIIGIIIAIIAILIVVFTLIVANKKRKTEIARVQDKKNQDK